ncbi:MAG: hypothetical protein AABX34_06145 [Nanoarchaeota archaeon]
MKRILVLAAIMALAALLVFGCARGSNNYQSGYATSGQPAYQGQQGGYVGGGCGVAGPDNVAAPNIEPSVAA